MRVCCEVEVPILSSCLCYSGCVVIHKCSEYMRMILGWYQRVDIIILKIHLTLLEMWIIYSCWCYWHETMCDLVQRLSMDKMWGSWQQFQTLFLSAACVTTQRWEHTAHGEQKGDTGGAGQSITKIGFELNSSAACIKHNLVYMTDIHDFIILFEIIMTVGGKNTIVK